MIVSYGELEILNTPYENAFSVNTELELTCDDDDVSTELELPLLEEDDDCRELELTLLDEVASTELEFALLENDMDETLDSKEELDEANAD